jgi:subtilisin family serine protease
VPGLAPRCTVLVVPGVRRGGAEGDVLDMARSIEAAIGAGAHVVVLESGLPSLSGDVDGLLKAVVHRAEEAGVLLVIPAGNESMEFPVFPQALSEVLVVGAYDDDGVMYDFSGWRPEYEGHGIVAPGGDITGPEPGGGLVTHKGTSCSAPVVGGVAALLLSLQVKEGLAPDPLSIRAALLETARPCTEREARGDLRRCLARIVQ